LTLPHRRFTALSERVKMLRIDNAGLADLDPEKLDALRRMLVR